VLQCVAVCTRSKGDPQKGCKKKPSNGLAQCVAVCCSLLQSVALCVALCCNDVMHKEALEGFSSVCCSVLQCVAVRCSLCCTVLQRDARRSPRRV